MRETRKTEGNTTRWIYPPEPWFTCINEIPQAIQTLEAHNDYCKVCYIVSRDVCCLSHKSDDPEHEMAPHLLFWEFKLVDLVQATKTGCHFCGLINDQFFGFAGHIMVVGGGQQRSGVACCSASRRASCLENRSHPGVESILERDPETELTFVLEAMDRSIGDSGFGVVRVSIGGALNCSESSRRQLGDPLDIDLEFFAVKGKWNPAPPQLVIFVSKILTVAL